MSALPRILAAAALLGGAAALVGALLLGRGSEEGRPDRWVSSEQCAACHAAIHAEWKGSLHAQAFTDPEPRRLSNEWANTDCIACHAPRPVFEAGAGQRVLPRYARRAEGVDCLSCHATARGMASTRPAAGPCAPDPRPDLASPEFCGGCHNQHGTVDEWRATAAAREGKTCNHCHMTRAPGADGKLRASHHFTIRASAEAIAAALTVDAKLEEGRVVVHVTNTGAAHDVPTDSRHKAIDLLARFTPESGAPGTWTRLARFRNPYRDDQFDLARTTIAAGATSDASADLPPGRGVAELLLVYKTNPFQADADALPLWRRTIPYAP